MPCLIITSLKNSTVNLSACIRKITKNVGIGFLKKNWRRMEDGIRCNIPKNICEPH